MIQHNVHRLIASIAVTASCIPYFFARAERNIANSEAIHTTNDQEEGDTD